MRLGAGFLALLILAGVGAPASAQISTGSSTSGVGGIWQSGTEPVPALYPGRQTPNQLPAAPGQPVSSQAMQATAPSWYPQAAGIAFAGGRLFTGGTLGTFYDDNVFATNTQRQHDWAFFERPEYAYINQGQNYTFTSDGFIEAREYARFSSEDQINGSVGANYTVMPDNNTQIVAGARYIHEHLDRGASETVVPTIPGALLSTLFTHPVAYDEGIESAALNKRYGNWWSSVGGAALEINYQNATIGSIGGVTPLSGDTVSFSYADGVIGTADARVGYVVMPLTSVFVEAAGNTRDWQVGYFDSTGFRVVGGMLFEQGPGARLKGEVWGGYMNQHYNGVTMQTISTWTYGIGLAAIVTDNLTAVVEGWRQPKEAALGLALLSPGVLGASAPTCTADTAVCVSDIESELGARLDYRILPKVVVGGGLTYLEEDYQGPLAFGRVDRTLGPLASVKYFYSPNVTFGFDYRSVLFRAVGGFAPAGFTTVAAFPYDRDIFLFWVNGKF